MAKITIKDIAKLLNVAPSTVSRALANHPDIGAKTKKRVQEVAQSLNYSPNLKAKYLRSHMSGLIALILPDINTFFTPALMNGINQVVEEKGYSLIIFQSDNSHQKEQKLLRYCANLSVEGILLSLSSTSSSLAHLDLIQAAEIPIVLLDKTINSDSFSSISIDGEEASYRAVSYLIAKGRKRIAGVFGDPKMTISQNRIRGYKRALGDHGIKQDRILIIKETNQFTEYWLPFSQKNQGIDACFVMSDELLVLTHHAIVKNGYNIPEEIALFAISDGKAPYYLYPNVTHLRHSGFEVGVKASRILFNLLSDLENLTVDAKLPMKLIELEST